MYQINGQSLIHNSFVFIKYVIWIYIILINRLNYSNFQC